MPTKRKYSALEFRLLELLDKAFPWIDVWGFSDSCEYQDKLTSDIYEVLKEHGLTKIK